MTAVILCGGVGSRLWPISRSLLPKQFADFGFSFSNFSGSLFTQCIERNAAICDNLIIVCNENHYFLAQAEITNLIKKDPKIAQKNISYILESAPRNTAPALALAALFAQQKNKNEILLCASSDHLISGEYKQAVQIAQTMAQNGRLATFGLLPKSPQSGFGYIEIEPNNEVKRFIEKPKREVCEEFLAQNALLLKAQNTADSMNCIESKTKQKARYLWNCGIFCFSAEVFLKELEIYAKNILEASQNALDLAIYEKDSIKIKKEQMLKIPEISVDYAIFEKSKKVSCVFAEFEWSDVGSFDSLYENLPKDRENNAICANFYENINSKRNLILSQNNKKIIALLGVEDLIAIDCADALLLAKRGSSQDLRQIVAALKNDPKKNEFCENGITTHRPWGSYTILEEDAIQSSADSFESKTNQNLTNYKVKRIVVAPQKRLSLQRHKYRNEHWIVVSGQALVEIDGKEFILNANESTYIKAGQTHRLSNKSDEDLVIIEAQIGSYTGEDDIERLGDDFNRV